MLFLAGLVSAVTMTAGVQSVSESGPRRESTYALMTGSDFGMIRREVLSDHPIGSKIADVADAIGKLGFTCRYRPHLIENTTAPTVLCHSSGRGDTVASRLDVVLVARNGTLTDVAISDGFDDLVASAMTPDPNPGGQLPEPAAAPVVSDPEWDAILTAAGKRYASPPASKRALAGISPAPHPGSDGNPTN